MLIYSFFDTSLDISRTVVEGSFTFSPAAILNEIAAPVIWFIVLWGAILLKNSPRKDRHKPKDIGVFEQSQNEFWNVPCNGLVSNYAYKSSVFVHHWQLIQVVCQHQNGCLQQRSCFFDSKWRICQDLSNRNSMHPCN